VSNTDVISALTRFSPYDELESKFHPRIAEHAEIISAEKGKILFKRGRTAKDKFYLLEGIVDLVDSGFNTREVNSTCAKNNFTLEDSSPTQVSAVAKSSVTLLKVDAEFLDIALAWSQSAGSADMPEKLGQPGQEQKHEEILDVNLSTDQVEVNEDDSDWMSMLLRSPLFTQISPAHIQNLFIRFESFPVKTGDVIIKEGEKGDYFYVIDQGRAQVSNLTGKVDVELSKGQFFGEDALVGDAPRNASITMLSDGSLMRLKKADFISLLQEPIQRFIQYTELAESPENNYQLLDVRLPMEFRHQHIKDSRNIPLLSLRDKLSGLDKNAIYVVADNAGRRSQVAAYLLCQYGLEAFILDAADQYY
jgi:CRP-like cAMP-binding protein